MNFVDRKLELGLLDDLYQREGAQFLILYGRRRIGKTRLLTHWLALREDAGPARSLYWMATQTSATNQLRAFSQTLFQCIHPDARVDETFSYASWEAALEETGRAAARERFVLVLDEFTYVMQADPQVPSLIQRAWDHQLKETSLFIILTGSLAGMIQRHLLDIHAPLYGRASARIRLQALSFGALTDLLPRYRPEQRLTVYAITGGVPAYIELFDDRLTVMENLRRRIVTPTNVMLGDAPFLLHEQLDEPRNYMAIIEAIAAGYHTLSEIARIAGIERSNIVKYLSVLQALNYVQRQVSATVRRPERSRKGRYVIVDPYLRFYFRFLAPNLSLIERNMVRPAIELITDHLPDFIGTHTFEELAREWIAVQTDLGSMPFVPSQIGSHWSRDAQVDVVAINWRERQILLGECKWTSKVVGRNVISGLVAKRDQVVPAGTWKVHYAFFSRSGFSPAALSAACEINARTVTLEDLETDMRRWLERS